VSDIGHFNPGRDTAAQRESSLFVVTDSQHS
jgi:hypothetical protein